MVLSSDLLDTTRFHHLRPSQVLGIYTCEFKLIPRIRMATIAIIAALSAHEFVILFRTYLRRFASEDDSLFDRDLAHSRWWPIHNAIIREDDSTVTLCHVGLWSVELL